MRLTEKEVFALNAWLDHENLASRAAASRIGTNHNSVVRWTKGGAINPSQYQLLLPLITPFMTDEFLRNKLLIETNQLPHFEERANSESNLRELSDAVKSSHDRWTELDKRWKEFPLNTENAEEYKLLEIQCDEAKRIFANAFKRHQTEAAKLHKASEDLRKTREQIELISRLLTEDPSTEAEPTQKKLSAAKTMKEVERLQAENTKLKEELSEMVDLKRRYDALAAAMKAML